MAVSLTRVMRAVVPIPTVGTTSVLHSTIVGGSDVGVVGSLSVFGELNNANWVSFDFNVTYSSS